MKVTIANIVGTQISVFDASIPYDGLGTAFLGVFNFDRSSGLINWFGGSTNRVDPWTLCQHLVETGYAVKREGGPGTYGHVDYLVTAALRDALAFQAEEAEEHGRQAEAELAAELNIPQHLVW